MRHLLDAFCHSSGPSVLGWWQKLLSLGDTMEPLGDVCWNSAWKDAPMTPLPVGETAHSPNLVIFGVP